MRANGDVPAYSAGLALNKEVRLCENLIWKHPIF